MFASFKKLFRKDTGEDLATSIPEVDAPVIAPRSPVVHHHPVPAAFTSELPSSAATPFGSSASADVVSLPLRSVVACLPNSLSSVVQSQGNGFVSFPAERIAAELPKGSVKLAFGEVRMAAPAGSFFDNARHDQVLIELPLNEILLRVHPSLLARRPNQKQILLPADITNIFGPRGEGISVSSTPPISPKPFKPIAHEPAPVPLAMATPSAAVPMQTAPAAVPFRVVPVQQASSDRSERITVPLLDLSEAWPELIRQEIAAVASGGRVALPMSQLEAGLKAGKIMIGWKQICEWTQPPFSSALTEDLALELPLKLIAPLFMAKYQPKVQKKIVVAELPDLFAIKNAALAPTVEPVAPIAMAKPAEIKMAPSPEIYREQPAAIKMAPPAEIKMASAPEMKMPQPAEVIQMAAATAKPNPLGNIFGQPAKTHWSPVEIVKNAAKLPAISGAFIAMQDGLLVAAELPSHLKGDTVAAFLPQIFGRMNQYAKELNLGALSSFSFVVERVSWQIIKTGTVYFVVIGKTGENLPGEKLSAIAAELGKQIQ